MTSRWAYRPHWHAVVTFPACTIHTSVTNYVCGHRTLGRCWRVTRRGTRIPCRHAVVSHPASIGVITFVTPYISWHCWDSCSCFCSRHANRRNWVMTCWWTNRTFRHTEVSLPAVSIITHVTNYFCFSTYGRRRRMAGWWTWVS